MRKLLKPSDSFHKFLIAAVLLAIPLYPKFPFLAIPSTYVSIRLEDFLIAVLAVITAIRILPYLRQIITGKIERSIIIFIVVGFISLLSGIILTKTVTPHIGVLHWIRRIEYLIPFFAGALIFKKKDENLLEFFIKTLMIVIVLAFVYGYGQKYFSWPVIITQNEEYAKGIALRWIPGSHINSTFAGHYDLATFLVLTLPIFVSMFFVLKGRKTKVVLGVVIFCGLWLMANAVSRISVVSFLMASTLALALVKKFKAIILVLLVSVVFFAFSTDLIARYSRIFEVGRLRIEKIIKRPLSNTPGLAYAAEPALPEKRINKFTPTPNPVSVFEDRSTSIRLNVEWPRAVRALSKNPLLGTGYSSITLATDNDYLRALGEVGVLGLAAFLLIFRRLGEIIFKSLPLKRSFSGIELAFLSGLIGGTFGILVNAFFIDIFEASKFAILFWLLIGFGVSMMRRNIYE